MNLKQALKLTSQRYDELEKLNTVKRTSIILWFYKNKKDILNDEHFEEYKQFVMNKILYYKPEYIEKDSLNRIKRLKKRFPDDVRIKK